MDEIRRCPKCHEVLHRIIVVEGNVGDPWNPVPIKPRCLRCDIKYGSYFMDGYMEAYEAGQHVLETEKKMRRDLEDELCKASKGI